MAAINCQKRIYHEGGNGPHPISQAERTLSFAPAALLLLLAVLLLLHPTHACAYTVTPATWNVVGLDSNSPASGPKHFPVGAKVCGGTPGTTDTATLSWESGGTDNGTYVYLRPGSNSTISITFDGSGCADAFFEVEVNQVADAYDQTRRYKITAGGASTPTPRELYVEHLVSQSRNGITSVKLDGADIPAGGAMNLIVGKSYTISLTGFTATQGYNQFESFINFPNTIFQILSVNTSYNANTSPGVPSPNPGLYADACGWDNDPASLAYRSCIGGDYKTGGDPVTTTYSVKILSGGGTSQTLNTLLYDFSGSSYHYNGDYSTSARIANIVDPASLTIGKAFSPNPTNVATGSTLTFTISNPNAGAFSGVGFTDIFPTSPGAMQLRDTNTLNTCGGTLTSNSGTALAVNDPGIKLTGGTVPANGSCVVQVNVKTGVTGSFVNTSQSLLVGTTDTGKTASATLTVGTTAPPAPPPSSCANPVVLARWLFDPAKDSTGATINPGTAITTQQLAPSYTASDVSTATTHGKYASGGVSTSGISNDTTDWGGSCSGGGSVNCVDSKTPGPNVWGIRAGFTGSGVVPTNSTGPYFEFKIDTSNYGGVGFTTSYDLEGNWSASDKWYLFSSDGSSWSAATSGTWSKGAWQPAAIGASAAATGTVTTTFRLMYAGAQNSTASAFIDDIVITGCPRTKPPSIAKRFAPNPILSGGKSTLTFVITNPNPAIALSGVNFLDPASGTLPGGMKVASPPNASTSGCGSPTFTPLANDTSLSFGSGSIAAGGTCIVKVDVTATSTGVNTTGAVGATGTVGGNAATDTLTIIPPDPVVSLYKEVATATSAPGPSSVLWNDEIVVKAGDKVYYQFTVQNDGDVPLDSVTVTDADLAAVDPSLTLANCVWNNGDDSVINPGSPSAQNFSLAVANNSNNLDFAYCIIGPINAVSGTKTNTATANAKYSGTAITPDSSTAKYNGFTAPSITKSFGAGNIASGGSTTLTLILGNPATNPGPLTSLQVDDTFPGGMTLKDTTFTFTPAACGTVTKTTGAASAAGDNNIRFSTASLAANATCQVQVNVTSSTPGAAANTTASPDSSGITLAGKTAPLSLTGTAANATLNVSAPPTLAKSFGAASIQSGETTTLRITLGNPAANPATLTTLQVDDTFPAGLTLKDTGFTFTPASCGTVTRTSGAASAAGDNAIRFAAATINAGSSCTVDVNVTSSTAGSITNTTSAPTAAGPASLTGSAASADLSVGGLPSITVVKSVQTYSDPVNGTTSPKPIPGAIMIYTIQTINSGTGPVDSDTMAVTDTIPTNMALCVSNSCSNPPVAFSCSATPACGLTYNYATDVTYSNQAGGGAPYNYTASPDANGYDANVTGIRINPTGSFSAASGGDNATFSLIFKVQVQ